MVGKGFYSNLAQNTEYWRGKKMQRLNSPLKVTWWREAFTIIKALCWSCKGIKLKSINKHLPGEAPHPGLRPQPHDTCRSSTRSCCTSNTRSFGAVGLWPVQQLLQSMDISGQLSLLSALMQLAGLMTQRWDKQRGKGRDGRNQIPLITKRHGFSDCRTELIDTAGHYQ